MRAKEVKPNTEFLFRLASLSLSGTLLAGTTPQTHLSQRLKFSPLASVVGVTASGRGCQARLSQRHGATRRLWHSTGSFTCAAEKTTSHTSAPSISSTHRRRAGRKGLTWTWLSRLSRRASFHSDASFLRLHLASVGASVSRKHERLHLASVGASVSRKHARVGRPVQTAPATTYDVRNVNRHHYNVLYPGALSDYALHPAKLLHHASSNRRRLGCVA